MDMVALVQRQQQVLDGDHQSQREQDHVNGTIASAESHAVDRFRGEAASSARETAVVASGNGSIGDSSTQYSDVDDDDEEEETDVEEGGAGGWITNLPVSSTIVQQQPAFATTSGDVVLPNADQPTFGDVRVQNSKNVRLVNKTCYNGPITLKQFVYTNPTPKHDASSAFDNTSDLSTSKDNEAPNECTFPQNTKLNKVTQWLWTWKRAVLSCVLTLILLAIVVPITVHFTRHSDASMTTTPAPTTPFTPTTSPTTPTPITPTTPEIPNSSTEGNNGTETPLRIVERDEWGARPPSESLRPRKLPVPYVIICHTVTAFCTTQSKCANQLRIMQDYQMKNNFSDIAYNFLVGGDGLAYVGRSWNYKGAHSSDYNGISIGIGFIGDFTSVVPPKTQLNAAQKLIEFGVEAKKIASDYILLGNRQVVNSESPGDALYNEIRNNWKNWSPCPPDPKDSCS
ncbi:uncharacterized protein [Temnothorax nylanderi]|uniref:uncharacterized protein n=1 Tax=Temnothorax nylanderi TaxID=102681 RepID=UPI003A8B3503